jgi:hypothetical protein
MQSPIPEKRAADAAKLGASIAEYLSGGGEIKSIPIGRSADYDPMHRGPLPDSEQRKEAAYQARMQQAPRARRQVKLSKAELRRIKWLPVFISMFDGGMNLREIGEETGQGRNYIGVCLRDTGRNTAANRLTTPSQELIDQIEAMALSRHTGPQTAVALGLPYQRVSWIARTNGIRFKGGTRSES